MRQIIDEPKNEFTRTLAEYRQLIDADIKTYSEQANRSALQTYGESSARVTRAFTNLLSRGGKRIRGTLTVVGYEMCGGTDRAMIIQAARAIEMSHAAMLILDDIQDRASLRRSEPSVHKDLESYVQNKNWEGDESHTGIALALNAALLGSHGAQLVLNNLEVKEEFRLKASTILNHTMMVTAQGQTNDIVNELRKNVTVQDIENVMQWKTAHYSVLNPIHTGMVLAGAGCEDTNAITEYALKTGKAFQIHDDLRVLSNQQESGKDAIDDIREGKQTLLTVYALQHAGPSDAKFLRTCLGKSDIKQTDFKRCQEIFKTSGAAQNAREVGWQYIETARESLHKHSKRWQSSSVKFLDAFAQSIIP